MQIKWLNELPLDFTSGLNFLKKEYKLPLQEAVKLIYITLKLKALSDSPIYKFLERGIGGIKFDEIERREYLLTSSLFTIRELIVEHLDLKLVKNLYLFLSQKFPQEFFKDISPKHSIITSQDVIIQLLSQEEKNNLPSFLKAKHIILPFKFDGMCEEIINILPLFPNKYIIKQNKLYQIFTTFSISEFIVFSFFLKEKNILKEEIEKIFANIKVLFPECFGEI